MNMKFTVLGSQQRWLGFFLLVLILGLLMFLGVYICIFWILLEANGVTVKLEFPTVREQIQWEEVGKGQLLGKYVFPVLGSYNYSDSWGAPRSFGGERQHEGTDIFALWGTPLIAVTDGLIEKLGWNTYGGWRIGLRGEDGIYYYYAHLSSYAAGIYLGKRVSKGEILGYAGNSGYGPVGTTGRFPPHLHFGIYIDGQATNPYPYLKMWEGNR
ncbi:Peptidase family M23 [Carboxydocella sporoproducens DSM 16521]|uniref:Peptidase family M23 n=2 Tax=Carboxydocella TaxID=178898 RepID=A0A1T4M258_9FIRM|nr:MULTISPECIES: M23 family metallopeptidase [Carboxydocella]AVX21081.1 Peptidase family M23 [Carboxydocella thermautotrophica]SJZ61011.1 Peptidase family M23 [Carboxydocella sporoproducens DSM 16521]